MSRACTVCQHPRRRDIDQALSAGESLRDIAGRFAVTKSSLSRHSGHAAAAANEAVVEERHALDLVGELRARYDQASKHVQLAEGLLGRAVGQSDTRTAVTALSAATRAISETRACLELFARLSGQVDNGQSTTVNVTLSGEWPLLRSHIVSALEPYPDARAAVLVSLNGHAGR